MLIIEALSFTDAKEIIENLPDFIQGGTDTIAKIGKIFGKNLKKREQILGIFVFAILIIINLVVVTKGAGRVSEVSARFTLDAMPGKQMAIDADLNAGILDAEQATLKRDEIAKEADFAKDGYHKAMLDLGTYNGEVYG